MTVTFPIYEGNKASLRLEHNNDENKDLASGADDEGGDDRGTTSGAEGRTNSRSDGDDEDNGNEGVAYSKAARDGDYDGEDLILALNRDMVWD